jgi:hypothetical protein
VRAEHEIRGSQELAPPEFCSRSGIALVITLLMLSVITFLAVALLVLTRSHRNQVDATLDVEAAKNMSEAAQARAISQIVSRLQAHTNLQNFDYTASHNQINPSGYVPAPDDYLDINYDHFNSNYNNGAAMSPVLYPADWASNIAKLRLDPRPPVFISTNPNAPADFRFWVDLNRNGRFETNGLQPEIGINGLPLLDMGGNMIPFFGNGEPEWIGVLQYPNYPHSPTNRFIGRYAFVALPIGKTLDLNYIHNDTKPFLRGASAAMPAANGFISVDGFLRDQGVGTWELNLAGFLAGLNTNLYYNPPSAPFFYNAANVSPNIGPAFDDAYSIVRYRYASNNGAPYPYNFATYFNTTPTAYFANAAYNIDEYGTGAVQLVPSPSFPWPGAYTTNGEYDIQDLFDPNKTAPRFVSRILNAGTSNASTDRYTFQRLLAGIGTGSAPELQTYVYDDVTNSVPGLPPTRLRAKVNINYDNSYEITNGLNTSPPVLIPWTNALAFFTNAADSLLRSQEFRFTNNYYTTPTVAYMHFGLTNIPVYDSLNPSIRYSEQIHRMLQVAANIYEATLADNMARGTTPHLVTKLPTPVVFRPLFATNSYTTTNGQIGRVLRIIGYTNVPPDPFATQILRGYKLASDPNANITTNDNVWGIPWVVGAVKGLPEFDRYVNNSSWMVTRKLLFRRFPAGTNGNPNMPPQYTNQFVIMSLNNVCGIDSWNAYNSNISLGTGFRVIATNFVYISITNNTNLNPRGFAGGFGTYTNNYIGDSWHGLVQNNSNNTQSAGMIAFLQTNELTLGQSYFSPEAGFVPVSGNLNSNGFNLGAFTSTNQQFLPVDLQQTTFPSYDWTLTVSNQIMYALLDNFTGAVYDFVNLGPFGQTVHLNDLLNGQLAPRFVGSSLRSSATLEANYWDTTPVGGFPKGLLNQITNAIGLDGYFSAELQGTAGRNPRYATNGGNSNLFFSCSNDVAATVFTGVANQLLVNDPLVHYTVGDLTPPPGVANLSISVLTNNSRYEPWPTPSYSSRRASTTLKDPLITGPDEWRFPTNLFPSVGWLGRVHRGTPWQTIFLKADDNPGPNGNPHTWVNNWVSTLDTYPTNDYAVLDLFTAAPNDNAVRGQLSVNQTNDAPWYAVFAGLNLQNNIPTNSRFIPPDMWGPYSVTNVDPTNIAYLTEGYLSTSGTNVAGINFARATQPDGVFHNIGSLFSAPSLSIDSPFLPVAAEYLPDEEVEAIPQQIAGLIKLGQPRFVIYSWGQALKPKDIYFGSQTNLFNLCTNYQITGEYLTRTVCHVVGNAATGNLKLQVDSFNILPAN